MIPLPLVRHDGEALVALIFIELKRGDEQWMWTKRLRSTTSSTCVELASSTCVELDSSACVELASFFCVETCADGTFSASSFLTALAAMESS